MKWFLVFVAVAISLTLADEQPERRGVLRRATRQAMSSFGGVFLKQTERNIIHNCKLNGLSQEGQDNLQETYNKMTSCMSSPIIFSVSKQEYIDKMVSCSRAAISETEDCLPPNQKYFPGFILDLAKSVVTFMYDDKNIMASREVPRCMNNFIKRDVQLDYIKCMTEVATQTHDDENIPNSKAEFCRKFIPAGECFPKTLGNYCSHGANVDKFLEDYSKALEQPCASKEGAYIS